MITIWHRKLKGVLDIQQNWKFLDMKKLAILFFLLFLYSFNPLKATDLEHEALRNHISTIITPQTKYQTRVRLAKILASDLNIDSYTTIINFADRITQRSPKILKHFKTKYPDTFQQICRSTVQQTAPIVYQTRPPLFTPQQPERPVVIEQRSIVREEASSTTSQHLALENVRLEYERLIKKLENVHIEEKSSVEWSDSRFVTPNSLTFLKRGNQGKPVILDEKDDTSLVVYTSGTSSQGLITAKNRTIGGSVTTAIHTLTERKDEKKSTCIQYDKKRVDTVGKDFFIQVENYRGTINYQGGHIIDHKFSAADSHTAEINYFPAHYFYNSPLKEHLVQRSSCYIEIPLFTHNPPRIGVKGNISNFHEIPIGVIFIQLSEEKMKNAYFFPNNDYDYESLKISLGITKNFAKSIVPYFKLKPSLLRLLIPACIMDVQHDPRKVREQNIHENRMFDIMNDIEAGMSRSEYSDEQDLISRISFDVINNDEVKIHDFLDITGKELKKIKQSSMQHPFNELGNFLIQYALKNALKSEVISTNSRLIFLNVIIDHFECFSSLNEERLCIIDDMQNSFKRSLKELRNIAETMDEKELLFLSHTYQRLVDPFTQAFRSQGYSIYNISDVESYYQELLEVLKIVDRKIKVEKMDKDSLFSLISLYIDVQNSVACWFTENPFEEMQVEEMQDFRQFLKLIRPKAEKWLGYFSGGCWSFSTGIDRESNLTTSLGFLNQKIKYLGTKSSVTFRNEDSVNNSSSSDVNNSENEISSGFICSLRHDFHT